MKKMITIIIIITLLALSNYNKIIIPKEAIRFRVIANSNTKYDQENKQKIAKTLSTDIVEILRNTNSLVEARNTLQNNISNFEKKANEVAKLNNYEEKINIDYGRHHFPKKEYKGITYKEGEYESLVITLGEGKGKNFWCILFPPICRIDEEDRENIEYKSFIKEVINKIL